MAFATLDNLLTSLATSQDRPFYFSSQSTATGRFINLSLPSGGSTWNMMVANTATNGGTKYDQGSITTWQPTWTSGGANTYIGRLGATSSVAGTLHVYDLLWASTGFSGTNTSSQGITNFVGLPTRNSTGVGAEIWFGIGSISIGSNNTTPTVSYTNSANTSSRTATLKQGTVVAGSQSLYTMIPMNLQNGDLGVKSIQSLTLSANAGAVGSIYLYIMQPVATIQLPVANLGNVKNAFELNLPQINDSSCLIFVSQSSTTTSGVIMGQISIVQG